MVQRGYTVKGTVRSTTSTRSLSLAEAFKDISGEGKLVLFEADIVKESSLTDSLFQGAEFVFHVASPCFLKGKHGLTGLLPVMGPKQQSATPRACFQQSTYGELYPHAL